MEGRPATRVPPDAPLTDDEALLVVQAGALTGLPGDGFGHLWALSRRARLRPVEQEAQPPGACPRDR